MKSISGSNKRPRCDDTPGQLPSPKKQRVRQNELMEAATGLLALADSLPTQAATDRRQAMARIEASLREDRNSLDLSGFSPQVLAAVSTDIPASALAEVRQLTLPANLHALPGMCEQMKELQHLSLEDYLGTCLDLRKWPQLQQLSGSVSAKTEEIHVWGNVDLALTSDRISKLRCFRHFDDGTRRCHALPGHAYYKTLPGRSQPDLRMMNSVTSFAGTALPIVCRHIANYVLPHLAAKNIPQAPGNGYAGIVSPDDLQKNISLETDQHFRKAVWSSRAYHGVSDSRFGLWAMQQLTELKQAADTMPLAEDQVLSKSFYAISSNHAMVLVLRYKPHKDEQFVEIMMDPNLTVTHRRNTEHHLTEIGTGARQWRFSALLQPTGLASYFFDPSNPALMFIDPSPRAEGEAPVVSLEFAEEGMENLSYTFLCFGVTEGIECLGARLRELYTSGKMNAACVVPILEAARWQSNVCGLSAAVLEGFPEALTLQMSIVEDFLFWHKTFHVGDVENPLPKDVERRLILPRMSLAELHTRTRPGHRPAFHALAEGILDLYKKELISSDTCFSLLCEQHRGRNLIETAILAHDSATLGTAGSLLAVLLECGAVNLEQCRQALDSQQPGTDRAPLSWAIVTDSPPDLRATHARLLRDLCTAERNRQIDWSGDWLSSILEHDPAIDESLDEELLLPLLTGQRSDAEGSFSRLQSEGKGDLAGRLRELLYKSKA